MTEPDPLFRRILGAKFDALPMPVQHVHDRRPSKELRGRCEITRGRGWVAPLSWFTNVTAREAVESGRYTFDVRAELAYIGLLVHYRGWLERDG